MKLSDYTIILDKQVIIHLNKQQHEAYRLYSIVKSVASLYTTNFAFLSHIIALHIPHYKSSKNLFNNLKQKFKKTIDTNPLFFYPLEDNKIRFKSTIKVYDQLNISGNVKGDLFKAQVSTSLFRKHCLFPCIASANYVKAESPKYKFLEHGRSLKTISNQINLATSTVQKISAKADYKVPRYDTLKYTNNRLEAEQFSKFYNMNNSNFSFLHYNPISKMWEVKITLSNFYLSISLGNTYYSISNVDKSPTKTKGKTNNKSISYPFNKKQIFSTPYFNKEVIIFLNQEYSNTHLKKYKKKFKLIKQSNPSLRDRTFI